MAVTAPERPLAGFFWMLLSSFCMVGVNGAVKASGTGIPPAQSAFIRFAFGVIVFLPMIAPILRMRFAAPVWRLFLWRGLSHVVAVTLWFYAMVRIPVAEVSAIGFLNPVILLLLGGLLMGEGLSGRRMLIALVAFIGAMIVLRPGLREVSLGHLSQLGAACCFAIGYLIAKKLSATVPATVVVAMLTFTATLGLLPLALLTWVPITLAQTAWLALAALFGTVAHYAMTRAFAVASMAVTQPVTFLQILWAALLGATFFGEPIDPWVLLGGGVIIGAISVNLRAEAVARHAATARAAETQL